MIRDLNLVVFSIAAVFLVPILFFLFRIKNSRHFSRLPPGPSGWPVVGNMFDLGSMAHKTTAALRKKYGPIIWLKLATKNTMVLLSAKSAAEFFKNHDMFFLNRTVSEVSKSHDYDKGSLALAPYGTYWRVMKRVMTVEMLVAKRINETVPIRRKCIHDLLNWIEKEVREGNNDHSRGVPVAQFVFLASFNMLGKLMLSRELVSPDSKEGSEFFSAMLSLMQWNGYPNVADLFPCLRRFDPQGLRRNMDRDMGKALEIVSGFVKERLKEREESGERKKDFLEVLLGLEGNEKNELADVSEHYLNISILEVFLAGSKTTSSTIEWAFVELLRNPEKMVKVKAELAEVLGPGNKFEESEIENLKYLQAVIKETMRLHPPIPFLVPRLASQDVEFMGYDIPKDTQVFVNAWAIGRDPDCWEDPQAFKPERFLDSKIDYKGQHYELIPFGAGRRICAGIPLAHRMLNLVLGSLLQEFEWEIPSSEIDALMDEQEVLGITVRKLLSLRAMPRKCMT